MSCECDVVVQAGEEILISADCAQSGGDIQVIVGSGGGGGGGPVAWSDITDRPTTVSGFGITDGVTTADARLTDFREWSADTVSQAEAEAGSSTARRAFTAQRVFQAIAAWWASSSAKTKLDGIASGATANATDAQLRDRSTHTGSQLSATISDFVSAALSAVTWSSITGKPSTFAPSSHASSHGFAGTDPITVDQAQVEGLSEAMSDKASVNSPTLNGLVTFAGDNSTTGSVNGDTAYFSTLVFANLTQQTTAFTSTLKTKLDGIASGATANATDAQLRDRSTHTGTQAAGTITGLAAVATSGSASDLVVGTLPAARIPATTVTAAAYGSASSVATFTVDAAGRLTAAGSTAISVAASAIASGTVATARLASGTASSSTFLRGDQTWAEAPVTSVDGSTGAVTVTKSEIYDFTATSKPASATGSGGSYSWTVPTGAKAIQILCVGAGAGGGSGRRGATSTARGGGAGGTGGVAYTALWAVSELPSTSLSIYSPAGGAGGAAATVDNTDGSFGSSPSETYVTSSGYKLISAYVVNAGGSGTTSGGSIYNLFLGSGGDYPYLGTPMRGGAGSATGAGARGEQLYRIACTGGGGGGAATSGNASGAGGDSWIPFGLTVSPSYGTDSIQGGTAGGGNGAAGKARNGWQGPLGGGGSGGGGNASGAGGARRKRRVSRRRWRRRRRVGERQ